MITGGITMFYFVETGIKSFYYGKGQDITAFDFNSTNIRTLQQVTANKCDGLVALKRLTPEVR